MLTTLAARQQKGPDSETPTWTKDALRDLSRPEKGASRFLDSNRAGVAFLDEGQLIVYEVDLDTQELSSRASPEISSPFRLRLSVLDSASGKLIRTHEEGTRAHDSAVFITMGGVLVKTGDLLKLFSSDLTEKHDVPYTSDRSGSFRVSVSPNRETILFNRVIQDLPTKRPYSHFDVLDAMTMKIRYSWNESPPLYHHYSISDKEMAAVNLVRNFIEVAEFGTSRWTRVAEPQGHCASMNMPTLYTNRQFVYGCDKLIAMSTEGHILMTDPFAKGQVSSDKTAVARDVAIVAASLNTSKPRTDCLLKHRLASPPRKLRFTTSL